MTELAQRRRLGRSTVCIGPLGFGGNALSNLYTAVDETQAVAAVRTAYAGGVRYFDTAPLYGHGLGEHRLGWALRGFPRDSYVRDEGLIGAIGIGVNDVDACLRLSDNDAIDAFMLAGRWTLLERASALELLARCTARGTAVIAAAPFNSGILATGAVPGARYNYLPAPPGIAAHVAALEAVCARHDVALTAAALQFPLRHPAVAAAVAGCRSGAETERSLAAFAAPIPAAFWDEVAALDADQRVTEPVS